MTKWMDEGGHVTTMKLLTLEPWLGLLSPSLMSAAFSLFLELAISGELPCFAHSARNSPWESAKWTPSLSVWMHYWNEAAHRVPTLDSFIVKDEANGVFSPQAPSQSGWFGSVRPSTDETGPVFPRGCPPSGSPHSSSSSWVSSPSRSPADSWWLHTGAGRPPNTPAGSPLPAVSGAALNQSPLPEMEAVGTFHNLSHPICGNLTFTKKRLCHVKFMNKHGFLS